MATEFSLFIFVPLKTKDVLTNATSAVRNAYNSSLGACFTVKALKSSNYKSVTIQQSLRTTKTAVSLHLCRRTSLLAKFTSSSTWCVVR